MPTLSPPMSVENGYYTGVRLDLVYERESNTLYRGMMFSQILSGEWSNTNCLNELQRL